MHLKKHRRRDAFSLVELLVVLAIIAVLITLTAAAVMRFSNVGVGGATKTNLNKVHLKLTEQWKGVTDGAGKESLESPINTAVPPAPHPQYSYASAAVGLSGGANYADERVRKQYVALRQRQAFPASFAEAFWPHSSLKPASPQKTAPFAWPAYVAYLAELGITPDQEATGASWGTIPQDVQAAVCVLMIIQKGPKNTGTTGDELGSAVGQLPLTPLQGTARGVVDAWKHPVLFTRRYQGKDATLALVSCGPDMKFGVDATGYGDATLAVGNQGDARDNVVVPGQ